MKKRVVISLVFVFMLGIASVGFAATNTFDDVPAKHWAYDAVAKLARDGILQADSDHSYKGDKIITRYEMAVMVANAMVRADKANGEDKLLIRKLEGEFASELNNLGMHVTSLEKKVDRIMMAANVFYRYDYIKTQDNDSTVNSHWQQYGGTSGRNRDQTIDFSLDTFYKINDNWTLWHLAEWQRDFWRSDVLFSSAHDLVKIMNVSGKVGATTVTVGRFLNPSAEGLVFDDIMAGAQVLYGNGSTIAFNIGTVDQHTGAHYNTPLLNADSPNYMGTNIVYQLNKATDMKITYARVSAADTSIAAQNYFEGGFDTKLEDKLILTVGYAKSTHKTDNLAYMLGISYNKRLDIMKPGDHAWWINYGRDDVDANLKSNWGLTDSEHGAKGIELGYQYVPMPKTMLIFRYDDMKATVANDSWKQKWYRAQVQFFM